MEFHLSARQTSLKVKTSTNAKQILAKLPSIAVDYV